MLALSLLDAVGLKLGVGEGEPVFESGADALGRGVPDGLGVWTGRGAPVFFAAGAVGFADVVGVAGEDADADGEGDADGVSVGLSVGTMGTVSTGLLPLLPNAATPTIATATATRTATAAPRNLFNLTNPDCVWIH